MSCILRVRREWAEEVKRHGPVNGSSKTGRGINEGGYMEGLQGMYARWVFRNVRPDDPAQDPVIPTAAPFDTKSMGELVSIGISDDGARRCIEALGAIAGRIGAESVAYAAAQPAVTDATSGVRVFTPAVGKVRLQHGAQHIDVNEGHYNKLRALYTRVMGRNSTVTTNSGERDPDNARCNTRIFCVVWRYEALSGGTSGFQGALPDHVFQALHDALGVRHECFASPLNCFFASFCSLYYDTDRFFGSHGSFWDFATRSGSFESNPPFVSETMTANVEHIIELLDASTEPLSFVIAVPAWDDCKSYELSKGSKHLRKMLRLGRKDHQYKDGMQHKVARIVWNANVDSFIFVLQNDAGAAKWPASDAALGHVVGAFKTRVKRPA